jgi:hypothetical protein
MAQLALGKLPKPDDPRDLQLKKYIRPKMIPRPPRSFGEERSIGKHNWGMLEVPAYLMTGIVPETWQVQESGDQEIIGGHYVPLVARRTTAKNVSWGRTYGITKPFLAKYCDEMWVPFSEEMLDHGGRSPEGFDRDELLRDLEALR